MLHTIKSNEMVEADEMKLSNMGVEGTAEVSCQRNIIMAYEKAQSFQIVCQCKAVEWSVVTQVHDGGRQASLERARVSPELSQEPAIQPPGSPF